MRRIISLITFSVSSILKQSNPLRRRLRCRRIRKADAERDGSVSAGDAPSVPGSSFIRQPVAGRICFLFTRKEISKSHGGGNRIEWLPQPWLHWFTNTRSVGPRVQTYSAVGGSRRPLDGRRLAKKTESPRGSRLLPVQRCLWRPMAGDWQTAANAGAYWSRIFRKCFEIRGSVIVWKTRPRKLSNIGVTIRIIVALTTKLSQYGAR